MYPISEIFGPTIQGEGPQIGTKTWFVRFAGCDWDCDWCDTKYAVNPKYPGWSKTMMSAVEISAALEALGANRHDWVTLSGGNPALFVDLELVSELFLFQLALETQGSVLIDSDTLLLIKSLVISPKPPSSGMWFKNSVETVSRLANRDNIAGGITSLKYVVFDKHDLEWVVDFDNSLNSLTWKVAVQRFLSVGTTLPATTEQIIKSTRWLAETILKNPRFANFRMLPQLHTLIWGSNKGV